MVCQDITFTVACIHHYMEAPSVYLALCKGNRPAIGGFRYKGRVTCSFYMLFLLTLEICWKNPLELLKFETPWCSQYVTAMLGFMQGIRCDMNKSSNTWIITIEIAIAMLLMDSCPGSRLSYDKYAYVQVVAGGILTYIASNRTKWWELEMGQSHFRN